MRVLYVKPSLAWPRASGHDIYAYYMMKGMADLGAEVGMLTAEPPDPRAVEGLSLAFRGLLGNEEAPRPVRLPYFQERFRRFWGVSYAHIQKIEQTVEERDIDVVIAFGLPTLPYLAGAAGALRVWAMTDEWVYHHLSQVQLFDRSTWHHARAAAVKGAYERAYRSIVDRFWAVSDTDLRAGRWLAGMKNGDLLPLGADTEFFRPMPAKEVPNSAIFWGRLDFEPNIDALKWFVRRVWPGIRRREPTARFTIVGYHPTPEVERLSQTAGVSLRANVPDLRTLVCEHALVVLPMISSGGIKNKLLEGAAMARPIVCTPRAAMDLKPAGSLPLEIVRSAREWEERVPAMWGDAERRRRLGEAARNWVTEYYSWTATAQKALASFERPPRG